MAMKNKTSKYLAPIVNTFDKKFKDELEKLNKVDWRIGHTKYSQVNKEKPSLFLLVKETLNISMFLDYFRRSPHYGGDYIFDRRHHMLVIKIPHRFVPAYEKFKESKYSEMYQKKDITKMLEQFIQGKPNPAFYILARDDRYIKDFQQVLIKEFNLTFTPEVEDREWDFPIKEKEELF